MKDITFTSNFGRFATSLTCTVGDEVNAATVALATQGMANVQFRAVASEVEKALIAAGAMTKETKRSEIPFTPANLAIIVAKGQEKLDAVAAKEGLPAMLFEVTGEHEYGEGGASAMVRATAFVDALLDSGEKEKQMRGLFQMLGLVGSADSSRESLINFAHEKKMGIQPAKAGK